MTRWVLISISLACLLMPTSGFAQAPVLYGDMIEIEEDIEIDLDDDAIVEDRLVDEPGDEGPPRIDRP